MRMWSEEKQKEEAKNDKIRYSGPVFKEEEYENIMDAIFSNWWSGGKYTIQAETKLSQISERNHSLLCNAGSSANLLLMSAAKELYFNDGDKIATLSCGFPTTVNPIIQNRLTPVFLDIDLTDLNLNPQVLEDALKKDKKIKGLFVAHTLGFKTKINEILDIARKYNIEVFFDNCDSYGTKYNGRPIQAYGKAVSYSFYVAHHISGGEGGGVSTNDDDFFTVARSMRSWGRYCASHKCCIRSENPSFFCPTAKLTKECELPKDYNVNYQFEYLGYNLKMLDLQAAMLLSQMDRLEGFNYIRRANYALYKNYFDSMKKFNFTTWNIDNETSPFSFPFLIPENAPFTRKHLIDHLTRNKIESRVLFGGNLMKHPAFANKKQYWESFGGEHINSNTIMNRFLMVGASPVLDIKKVEKVISTIDDFLSKW